MASNFNSGKYQPVFRNTCKYSPSAICSNKNKPRREIYYHINAKQMKEVADFIEPFRKMWDDRIQQTGKLIMKNGYKPKINYHGTEQQSPTPKT